MDKTYNNVIDELFKALEGSMGTVELFEDDTINTRQDAMYKALKLKQKMLNEEMDKQKESIRLSINQVIDFLRDQQECEEGAGLEQVKDVLKNALAIKGKVMANVFAVGDNRDFFPSSQRNKK